VKRINIVIKRDYRELRHSAAFRIMIYVAAAVTAAAAAGISIALDLQSWPGKPGTGPLLELFVGLVAFFLPFFVMIAFTWSFATLPVIKEKVNGNLESLMATPLTPRELWLGKSLAVFLPAYVISIIAAVVVVLVINLTAILPATGGFVLAAPALVLGLIVNPLLFFTMLLFIILFSIASNPDVAIAPSFLIGFGLMMGMPAGLGLGWFDISSWSFTLWYLAGTVVLLLVVLYLTRILKRQNIVLSSKGS
jgi:ABC-type Na+ efflux pump permease subunit